MVTFLFGCPVTRNLTPFAFVMDLVCTVPFIIISGNVNVPAELEIVSAFTIETVTGDVLFALL